MFAQDRQERLLAILERTRQIVAREASVALEVSEDTIRRDLRDLAKAGRLKRVHGGAVPSSPATSEFAAREPISIPEKQQIAALAATLVQPGQSVFIDGGTTTALLVQHLPIQLRATVITHSPTIAAALMRHAQITVEIIGGRLFRHSIVATGAETLRSIERFHPDLGFIGVTGIHPIHGLTTGDSEEALIKRALIERCGEAIVMASPEKLGAVSGVKIAGCEEIDRIVVASSPEPSFVVALNELGCAVDCAG